MHRPTPSAVHRAIAVCLASLGGLALPQSALAQADATPAVPQLVVSATRHAMPLADAPAAMTVVSAEQVAERGSDNLLAVLRGEPGISSFGRPVGGRKALSLRGMDPRHTLVLMDGQRVAASDGLVGSSDFQLDWTSALDIARVEVVRGPMSVLYGAEALGGVVQVFTRPLPEAWSGQALVEGRNGQGGADGHRAGAALRGALAPTWRMGVSATETRRTAMPALSDPRLSAVEGRHALETAARLVWAAAPGHEVALDTRASHEDRWLDARERSGAQRYHQSLHTLQRNHAGLGWTAQWDGGVPGLGTGPLETRLRAYRSQLDVRNQKTQGVASLRPNKLHDTVLEGQALGAWAGGHRATAGFEWREERVDNSGLPGGQARAEHRALFVQDEWQARPTLAVTAGLRLDHHERFGQEISPRAYAVWRPAADWVVKGGLGHGFKAPTLKQIDPAYREDEGPHTYLGRADLQPEVNNSAEVGLAWDSRHWGAQAMLFSNRVQHLIVPKLVAGTPSRGTFEFQNTDRARLQGLEAGLAWRQGPWALQAHGTWLSARDGQGQWLEKRAARTLGLQAVWQRGGASAGLAVEHQGSLRLASAVAGQPPQDVGDLTCLNLHARLPLRTGLNLRAGLDNATQVRLATRSPLFSYEELPRTWRLGLDARW